MSSIFTKIVDGEIPSFKVAENNGFLAFLDVNPLVKGHVLVIPKQEVDYYFDLPDELMAAYSLFVKKVARAIKSVLPCKRIGVAVIGLEVPHAHTHLIPINKINDMNFANPKLTLSEEELSVIAKSISEAFISIE